MSQRSYLTRTSLVGLLDELTKLAEAQKEPSASPAAPEKKPSWWKTVGKDMAVGAAGAATGYGIAHGVEHAFPQLRMPSEGRATVARILLPILGGASLVLANRYRRLMDEAMSEAPGWKKPE